MKRVASASSGDCGTIRDRLQEKRESIRRIRSRLRGTINISGAFALYPMAIKWAEEFKNQNPGDQLSIFPPAERARGSQTPWPA